MHLVIFKRHPRNILRVMKKTLSIFFILIFLISNQSFASVLRDTEVRKLDDFSKVTVATGINLVLVAGSKNEAEIEVDNIDLDDIITRVSGDKLTIKIQNWGIGIKKGKHNRIDITLTVSYTHLTLPTKA